MKYDLRNSGGDVKTRLFISCYKSTPFRRNNKYVREVCNTISTITGIKIVDKALMWFVSNVGQARRLNCLSMSVKLRASYWTGNVAGIGYRRVVAIVDKMEELGYIDIYRGYTEWWKEFEERDSSATILSFNKELIDMFQSVEIEKFTKENDLKENEYIVIRDRDTREKMKTTNFDIEDMTQQIKRYNEALGRADIKYDGVPVKKVEYFRSFTDSLDKGGRLYVAGGGVQTLSEEDRNKHLTIGGSAVVELDYSSMHPNMLYEEKAVAYGTMMSKQLGDNHLPYDFKYSRAKQYITVDEDMVAEYKLATGREGYDPARNLRKVSVLIALNSRSLGSARDSINYELFQDKKKPLEERKFHGVEFVNTFTMLNELTQHNKWIKEYFFKDVGIVLQYLDSEIALGVIDYMMQRGEVVLCYHDSFIAKEENKEMLESAMKESWKTVLKGDDYCKITSKGG